MAAALCLILSGIDLRRVVYPCHFIAHRCLNSRPNLNRLLDQKDSLAEDLMALIRDVSSAAQRNIHVAGDGYVHCDIH